MKLIIVISNKKLFESFTATRYFFSDSSDISIMKDSFDVILSRSTLQNIIFEWNCPKNSYECGTFNLNKLAGDMQNQ